MHTDVHRDIQYKNCSVQHSQVSVKHTFQACLPHNTTLLFKTGVIVHFHPRSHIQIQGAILMLGYWRNTHSFSKLLCAITIIFNVTLANLLRTKQQVLGILVGISHPLPKSCNLKVSTQQLWAVLHNATLYKSEAKEKGSQSQLHEDNAVPTGSSPMAHYVHNLHCRDVHLGSQTFRSWHSSPTTSGFLWDGWAKKVVAVDSRLWDRVKAEPNLLEIWKLQ